MAENTSSNTPFPNPPEYWQSFTAENLAKYAALDDGRDSDSGNAIPDELKNLRPPTPPSNGEYSIFGEKRSLAAPQKDLPEETPVLKPTTGTVSSPQHLLNLSRSLMLSYLELLHIMAKNPEPPIYGPKWEDLRDLFKNIHHGLNAYRPWQARDALIKLLEQTRDNARAEIEGVKGLRTKVDQVLQSVAQDCELLALPDENADQDAMNGIEVEPVNGKLNGSNHAVDDETQLVWALIDRDVEE